MELSCDVVQVIHDYELPGKGFLPIKKNELLSVIERDPTGWWLGCNVRGRKGVFPSTYCVPYQIQVPLPDTEAEFRLLRKSQDLNLNLLGPTMSPINLEKEQISPPQATHWRSSSERAIADSLVELLHKKERLKSSIIRAASDLSTSEEESASKSTTTSEAAAAVATVASTPGEYPDGRRRLSGEIENVRKTILRDKLEFLKTFQLPPLSWYRRFAELLEPSETRTPPLVLQLDDVREALQLKEASIDKTLKRLTDEEHSYVRKRDQVTDRIHQRDALVIALLEDWASSAQTAKTQYTSAKEEVLRVSNMAERIAACQSEVDLYESKYAQRAEQLHRLEDTISTIKVQLSRKQHLIDMDTQIKRINEQLAAGGGRAAAA